MNILLRLLLWLWGIIVTILLGVLVNEITPLLQNGKIKKYIPFFCWSFIILSLATLVVWYINRKRGQYKKFDLYKATNKLKPKDLGFTVLAKGIKSSPNERPYYKDYISRKFYSKRNSDKERGVPATDSQVLERIKMRYASYLS